MLPSLTDPLFLARLPADVFRSSRPPARLVDWRIWRGYFEHNARRPLPVRLRAGAAESERLRALPVLKRRALLRCLAVFQRGEAGEGRIAREIDSMRLPWIDDDYRAAIKLFVAEEGRHARLLALLITGLGGRLLAEEATPGARRTAALFTRARRLLGLRFKLFVLATAECAGIAMYRTFARMLPPGLCRNILREIVADEKAHLALHAASFRAMFFRPGIRRRREPVRVPRPAARLAFRIVWRTLYPAAGIVMWFTIRRDLRVMGIAPGHVLCSFAREARGMERRVLAPT